MKALYAVYVRGPEPGRARIHNNLAVAGERGHLPRRDHRHDRRPRAALYLSVLQGVRPTIWCTRTRMPYLDLERPTHAACADTGCRCV